MNFFDSKEREDIWMKIYNEDNDFINNKLTKVFEVTSLLAALCCSIATSFLVKESKTYVDYIRQFFSTFSILVSLMTVSLSIIFIVMINVLTKDKVEDFIKNYAFYFIFPSLGLIISICSIIISILFYNLNVLSYILMPLFLILVLLTLIFYCRIRNYIVKDNKQKDENVGELINEEIIDSDFHDSKKDNI